MQTLNTVLKPLHRCLEHPFRPLPYIALTPLVPLTALAIPFALIVDNAQNLLTHEPFERTATPIKAAIFSIIIVGLFVAKVAAAVFIYHFSIQTMPLGILFFMMWPIDLTVASILSNVDERGIFSQIVYEGGRLPQKFKDIFTEKDISHRANPFNDFQLAVISIAAIKDDLLKEKHLQSFATALFNLNPITPQGVLALGGKETLKANYKALVYLTHTDKSIGKASMSNALFCLVDSAYKCATAPQEEKSCLAGLLSV